MGQSDEKKTTRVEFANQEDFRQMKDDPDFKEVMETLAELAILLDKRGPHQVMMACMAVLDTLECMPQDPGAEKCVDVIRSWHARAVLKQRSFEMGPNN
jgi:hypothetical protein